VITVYRGEQRRGRVKFTTDRDCLAPDIIRFDVLVFPSLNEVMEQAALLESRGYLVCVDTEEGIYETGNEEIIATGDLRDYL